LKIQKLKAREADYAGAGAKLQTLEVRNMPKVRDWFFANLEPNRPVFSLLGDNRKALREIFGPVSFCFHGGHYFHGHLFRVELGEKSAEILVMTAREHGSSYEVVTRRDGKKVRKDPEVVIHFLEWLSEQLKKQGV